MGGFKGFQAGNGIGFAQFSVGIKDNMIVFRFFRMSVPTGTCRVVVPAVDTVIAVVQDPVCADRAKRNSGSGIVENGSYDANTDTLYLKFTGVTADAASVDLKVQVSDLYGRGQVYNIADLDVLADGSTYVGSTYVAKVNFTATRSNDGYPLMNRILVSATETDVNEWYVQYDNDNDEAVFTEKQLTVANVEDAEISFTLGLPEDVSQITYKDNTSTGVTTPTYAAITKPTTYTVALTGKLNAAPEIKVTVDSTKPVISEPGTSAVESRPEYTAAYALAGVQVTTEGSKTTIGGYTQESLNAVLNNTALRAVMEGTTQPGYLWVGVNFASPKDANGDVAKSCTIEVNNGGAETADYHDGVAYQWFGVAEIDSSNPSTPTATLLGDGKWTVELVWTFDDGTTLTETYTVVREAPETPAP